MFDHHGPAIPTSRKTLPTRASPRTITLARPARTPPQSEQTEPSPRTKNQPALEAKRRDMRRPPAFVSTVPAAHHEAPLADDPLAVVPSSSLSDEGRVCTVATHPTYSERVTIGTR